MIVDEIRNIATYTSIGKMMNLAVNFIQNNDLRKLNIGKHEINGTDLYAIVINEQGRKKEDVKLEIHRRYADIQIVLDDGEQMGWKPVMMCKSPVGEYNSDKDIQFFYDPIDVWLPVPQGWFAIFLPSDAHAPMVSDGKIYKVVIKFLL